MVVIVKHNILLRSSYCDWCYCCRCCAIVVVVVVVVVLLLLPSILSVFVSFHGSTTKKPNLSPLGSFQSGRNVVS